MSLLSRWEMPLSCLESEWIFEQSAASERLMETVSCVAFVPRRGSTPAKSTNSSRPFTILPSSGLVASTSMRINWCERDERSLPAVLATLRAACARLSRACICERLVTGSRNVSEPMSEPSASKRMSAAALRAAFTSHGSGFFLGGTSKSATRSLYSSTTVSL